MSDTANVTITGTLKSTGGTLLANQPVTFTDDNADAIPGVNTDANGNYTTTAVVKAPATNEKFNVDFAGGGGYKPSTGSETVNLLADTTITITVTQT